MAAELGSNIEPAQGNLGVLTVGLGAVSTTLIAGVEAVRQLGEKPFGSVTQMGRIRLGLRTEDRNPLIKEFVPLADLSDLRFGAWDIYPADAYEAALHAQVLREEQIRHLRPGLSEVRPMPAVFDQNYVKRLRGEQVKSGANKMELAEQVMDDITKFKRAESCDRAVMVYAASTETYIEAGPEHQDVASFERALVENNPNISPSMIYAYAALQSGIPFINGSPGLSVDTPALMQLAQERELPITGKDFKTGQTLVKTVLAPMFKARMLGIDGWFSTNILGNRDGEVLDDPGSFQSKKVSKESVLDGILQVPLYPDLYGDMDHQVHINYYRPKGDDKEGWDHVDFFGWLGYKMQMEVTLHCKDSILAAPVALDLILFMDLAQRSGMKGVQEWLSFYWKNPMTAPGLYPEHDLAIQQMKMKNRLRVLQGEEPINHVGLEYYD